MLLLPVSSATAVVTLGNPLTGPFPNSSGFSPAVTVVMTKLPEPGATLASPVNGTIITWRLIPVQGGPFHLRVIRPAGFGAYTGAGTSTPQTPVAYETVQAYPTNLPIKKGDLIGIDDTNPASTDAVRGATVPGAETLFWAPPLADGQTRGSDFMPFAVEYAFNADVEPDNVVALGKPQLKKSNGTAKLTVTVPNAGALALFGQGLRKVAASPTTAGPITLTVRSKGHTKQELNEDGKEKVRVRLSFTPVFGTLATKAKGLTLRKNVSN